MTRTNPGLWYSTDSRPAPDLSELGLRPSALWDEVEDWDLVPPRPTVRRAYGLPEVDAWSFHVATEPTDEERWEEEQRRLAAIERQAAVQAEARRQIEETRARRRQALDVAIEPVDLRPWKAPIPVGPIDWEPAEPEPVKPANADWRTPNRWAQICSVCDQVVVIGAGVYRPDGNSWECRHLLCLGA